MKKRKDEMLAVQTSAPPPHVNQVVSDWLAGGNSRLWPSFLRPSLACSSRRELAVAAGLPPACETSYRLKTVETAAGKRRNLHNLRDNALINGESVCRGTVSNLFIQVETFPRAVSFTPESVRNNEQIHHSTPLFKGFSHCIPLIGR